MQVFVWRGPKVLKNYRDGMVVVAATTADEAWARLAREDADVYWCLKTGRRLHAYSGGMESEGAALAIQMDTSEDGGLEKPEEGFPLEPEAFALDALPVLIKWGGE